MDFQYRKMDNMVDDRHFKLILCLLFPMSVMVDLTNGYTQMVMGLHLPIGVLYRGDIFVMLLYHMLKLRRDNLWKYYFMLMLLTFVLSFGYWQHKNVINITMELNELIRIVYLILMIIFFKVNMRRLASFDVVRWITNYGFLIALAIILSFLTGWGQNSYGEDYGFGTKSFFKAGNDLGMTLLYASVFASVNLFHWISFVNFFKFIIIVLSMSLVGSRIGIIGAILVFSLTCICYAFFYKPSTTKEKNKKKILVAIFIPMLSYGVYLLGSYIYSLFDNYAMNKLTMDSIKSARSFLTDIASEYIDGLRGLSFFLGEGSSTLFQEAAHSLNLGLAYEAKTIEADFHELIGSYGFLGGILILCPFVYYALRSIFLFLRSYSIHNFWALFIFSSFIVLSFLAGHAIKNAMVAPIYAFSTVYFFPNRKKFSI